MAIEFDCPNCRSRIRTPDDSAGKKALCPSCQQVVPIPGGGSGGTVVGAEPFPSRLTGGPAAPAGSLGSSYNPFREGAASSSSDAPFGAAPSRDAPQVNPYAAAPTIPTEPYSSYSQPFDRNKFLSTLRIPAILILIVAILSLGYWLVVGVASMIDFFGGRVQGAGNNAEVFGTLVGMLIVYIPVLVVQVLTIIGSIAMLRGKSYRWSMVGAIAGLFPCSPCCFLGLGFAIWAVVLLCQPNARSAFV